jgi:hypothetical protein
MIENEKRKKKKRKKMKKKAAAAAAVAANGKQQTGAGRPIDRTVHSGAKVEMEKGILESRHCRGQHT